MGIRLSRENCLACDGMTCKGGGDPLCALRNPRRSVVAAVLDRYGGVRVVVTHRSMVKHHVRADEICVPVPGLTVHEPIGWNDIPTVVARAHQELDRWIDENRPNEPWKVEACTMRRLRRMEHTDAHRALNLEHIADT